MSSPTLLLMIQLRQNVVKVISHWRFRLANKCMRTGENCDFQRQILDYPYDHTYRCAFPVIWILCIPLNNLKMCKCVKCEQMHLIICKLT